MLIIISKVMVMLMLWLRYTEFCHLLEIAELGRGSLLVLGFQQISLNIGHYCSMKIFLIVFLLVNNSDSLGRVVSDRVDVVR